MTIGTGQSYTMELSRRAAQSEAFCASRITSDSFLFRHDQRGGRQLRLVADQRAASRQRSCFVGLGNPSRRSVVVAGRPTVFWSQQRLRG